MHAILSVFSLLLGVAVILAGNGLLGTLLGVRGQLEAMSAGVLGLVMAAYFAGFMLGTFWIPRLIRRIGHIRVFATMASMASVVTLLHGLYVDAALWFVLRIISGICVVGLYISIESWLNAQTSNEQRGHVFSAYMTTTLVGLGIGQLLLITGDAGQLELFALASVLLSLGLVPVATTRVIEPVLPEAQRLGLRRLYAISPLGVVGCVFSGPGVLMQRFGPEALMMFMAASALVPALFAVWRMRVRGAIPVAEQGDFVHQFATSPAVLEMLPDAETDEDLDPESGGDPGPESEPKVDNGVDPRIR